MTGFGENLPSMQGFDMGSIPSGSGYGYKAPDFSNWGEVAKPAFDNSLGAGFFQQRYADGSTGGGYGSAALGVLQGLGSVYMGMKQYGLAKQTLEENKKQFNLNYNAQKQTTNASLEDRQAARVASNPGAYQSVGDYMKKNRIA